MWDGGTLVLLADRGPALHEQADVKPPHGGRCLIIQGVSAFVVLYWDFGRRVLRGLTNGVQVALDSSNAGIESLFGPVLTGQGAGPVFAFRVLPITIFASLTSVLYYLGVLQFVVNGLGRRLYKALGTGGPESLGHLRHLPGSSRTCRAGPRGAS